MTMPAGSELARTHAIEAGMQAAWAAEGRFNVTEDPTRPPYYVLDMFPYPSGSGLHVGHIRGYVATDVIARAKTAQGFNVLHPMGWDAFGLPAEQYAIKHQVHPSIAVDENIANFKKQISLLGLSYDWDREVKTTDPDFVKWTQKGFLIMLEKGLAYESEEPINWCDPCQTGLANEDLEGDACERCSTPITLRQMRQWSLRITDYAEKLVEGMEGLEWEPMLLEMQRNWIGLQTGHDVPTRIAIGAEGESTEFKEVRAFTTEPEKLLDKAALFIASDSALALELAETSGNTEILATIERWRNLPEIEKKKNPALLKLEGVQAVNPISGQPIEVFIDPQTIAKTNGSRLVSQYESAWGRIDGQEVSRDWEQEGRSLVAELFGLPADTPDDALRAHLLEYLRSQGVSIDPKRTMNLQDWVFSRQRYWGEPIPIVHCDSCGTVPLPEDQLPLELPHVESYQPSGTGESPLATIEDWMNTECPHCAGPARRESNTMPQWAGSSWYWNRYKDPHNQDALVGEDAENYWGQVDLCIGGAEHATRHLIYARFWQRVLNEAGVVSTAEPFARVEHVGLILGPDGRKMGKRYGNVVDPADIVEQYGADTLRVYMMFMGDFSQNIPWQPDSIKGAHRFLARVSKLATTVNDEAPRQGQAIAQTATKIMEDIESLKLNTAVAKLMSLARQVGGNDSIHRDDLRDLLVILNPFAPHISEHLWNEHGDGSRLIDHRWPELAPDDFQGAQGGGDMATQEVVITVNGSKIGVLALSQALAGDATAVLQAAGAQFERVRTLIESGAIQRMILPPGRGIMNIVS